MGYLGKLTSISHSGGQSGVCIDVAGPEIDNARKKYPDLPKRSPLVSFQPFHQSPFKYGRDTIFEHDILPKITHRSDDSDFALAVALARAVRKGQDLTALDLSVKVHIWYDRGLWGFDKPRWTSESRKKLRKLFPEVASKKEVKKIAGKSQ